MDAWHRKRAGSLASAQVVESPERTGRSISYDRLREQREIRRRAGPLAFCRRASGPPDLIEQPADRREIQQAHVDAAADARLDGGSSGERGGGARSAPSVNRSRSQPVRRHANDARIVQELVVRAMGLRLAHSTTEYRRQPVPGTASIGRFNPPPPSQIDLSDPPPLPPPPPWRRCARGASNSPPTPPYANRGESRVVAGIRTGRPT